MKMWGLTGFIIFARRYHMAEQQLGIPLADGLSCTLDATKEHPERYATIIGGAAPLSLNKIQALALYHALINVRSWMRSETAGWLVRNNSRIMINRSQMSKGSSAREGKRLPAFRGRFSRSERLFASGRC